MGNREKVATGLHVCPIKIKVAFCVHTATDRRGGEHLWVSSHPSALDGQNLLGDHPPRELMQWKILRLSILMPISALWRPLCGTNLSPPRSVDRPKSQKIYISLTFQLLIRILSLSWSPASYTYLHSNPSARWSNDMSVGAHVKWAGTVFCILQTWKFITEKTKRAVKVSYNHWEMGAWKLCLL